MGAGKTVCADIACLYTVDSGYQAALVAPTEILAEQLYSTLRKFISKLDNPPKIVFFSSKLSASDKKRVLDGIANGFYQIVIGTHSVMNITDFHNLGLVVVDEQQKFGTRQRDKLLSVRKDGKIPDLLSQTATPIPRSTALAFYGDIDLIMIQEKPANRKPIITSLVKDEDSEEFICLGGIVEWTNILRELKNGKQMFIVILEKKSILILNKK